MDFEYLEVVKEEEVVLVGQLVESVLFEIYLQVVDSLIILLLLFASFHLIRTIWRFAIYITHKRKHRRYISHLEQRKKKY